MGLVRALGIEKPILVGHSMGGSTAARAAADHPDMFRALILEDPADLLARTSPLGVDVIPEWREMVAADRERSRPDLMDEARTVRHPGWSDVEYSRWADAKKLADLDVVETLRGMASATPRPHIRGSRFRPSFSGATPTKPPGPRTGRSPDSSAGDGWSTWRVSAT